MATPAPSVPSAVPQSQIVADGQFSALSVALRDANVMASPVARDLAVQSAIEVVHAACGALTTRQAAIVMHSLTNRVAAQFSGYPLLVAKFSALVMASEQPPVPIPPPPATKP